MITIQQADQLNDFHAPRYDRYGHIVKGKCLNWRRNGVTKFWKTRPEEFRVPVKFGLYSYTYVSHDTANGFYAPNECPNCKETL